MDYHNRTDFRAFDVLAQAIIKATPAQLDAAIKDCAEVVSCQTYKPTRRLLFRGFANLLRLYRRKYGIKETLQPLERWVHIHGKWVHIGVQGDDLYIDGALNPPTSIQERRQFASKSEQRRIDHQRRSK